MWLFLALLRLWCTRALSIGRCPPAVQCLMDSSTYRSPRIALQSWLMVIRTALIDASSPTERRRHEEICGRFSPCALQQLQPPERLWCRCCSAINSQSVGIPSSIETNAWHLILTMRGGGGGGGAGKVMPRCMWQWHRMCGFVRAEREMGLKSKIPSRVAIYSNRQRYGT